MTSYIHMQFPFSKVCILAVKWRERRNNGEELELILLERNGDMIHSKYINKSESKKAALSFVSKWIGGGMPGLHTYWRVTKGGSILYRIEDGVILY